MRARVRLITAAVLVAWMAGVPAAGASEWQPAESKRLASAKDFIADEQWTRAIEVLQAHLRDPRETGKDEALYWLAHSLKHSGDSAGALSTIRRLELEFPSSLWVKPAGALRLEIAVRVGRSDVLWLTAAPPVPPAPPTPPGAAPKPATVTTFTRVNPPTPPSAVAPPSPPGHVPATVITVSPSAPASVWLPESYKPDTDLRIQALGHLMRIDADKAIPVLVELCFEENAATASKAVFLLAQSQRPEARQMVVQVAQSAATPVRVAAVREFARFGGADVSNVLLRFYLGSDVAVKRQVVKSLAERAEKGPLLTIAQTESDRDLRTRAIFALSQAGGRQELHVLYSRAGTEFKRPIIRGLFNARAEHELIQLAERERDAAIRQELLNQLRLLGTPKAKEYLQKVSNKK